MTRGPKTPDDLQITVALCTYNRYPLLEKAVKSCMAQTLAPSKFKVVIVDNSPDHDRAAREARAYAKLPNVEYVIEKIPGLSNARNVAVRGCESPYIIFLDDDAIASPGWLEAVLEAFALPDTKVGIVGGRIDPLWETERPAWLADSMLGSLTVVDWGGDDPRVALPSEWFAGANIGFRTEAIREIGYFDTSLGRKGNSVSLLSNEESDVVEKMEAAGYERVYAPRASVDHLVPKNRLNQTWLRKRAAWQAASDLMMKPQEVLKWAGASAWDNISRFLAQMPVSERSYRGLFADVEDPKLFAAQLDAIYVTTLLSLTGFEGVE